MPYILILTLFALSSQSGSAVSMQRFESLSACENARDAWLASVPREKDDPKYYAVGNYVRALCVPLIK